MLTSRHYSYVAVSLILLISVSWFFVPSWTGAVILSTSIAMFSVGFLYVIKRSYDEHESVFKRSAENIRLMAYYDDLTGLPNRRYAREQLEQALSEPDAIIAACHVDIDRFRIFNDTLGRDFGDIILLQAAERLTRCVRQGDTVARLEGDEFILLYPNLNHDDQIDHLVHQIHEAFTAPFTYQDYQLHTTVSIGVAVTRSGEEHLDADSLIKYAGLALSKAKEQGNVKYKQYTPAMDRQSIEKLKLEHELRRAIAEDEFILHYQPQIELTTGEIVGVEALIRWQHPVRGIISPVEFIPLAEEIGLITLIGDWVMKEACRQIKQLHSKGYDGLHVAVNLSARQFLQKDLVNRVETVLRESGLEAHYLELEITEGMTMDVERSIEILRQLQKLGVRISIDDFGTGYSSLNYLKIFPIHKLKIDRGFVQDIMNDPNDAAIVSTIISMAHHLNLKVIAEGVETTDQLRYLDQNRCNEIQGYLVSPPVAYEKLVHVLAQQQFNTDIWSHRFND